MLLPSEHNLPIRHLASVFKNTTNSYKFYWLLAILEEVEETDEDEIPMAKLALRMLSLVWYPLDYYKLSFGKSDSFKTIAQDVSNLIQINNSPSSPTLLKQLEDLAPQQRISLERNVSKLLHYVPFRFLSGFFRNETVSLPDSQINSIIKEQAHQLGADRQVFYHFQDQVIVLNPTWKAYFKKHLFILRGFTYWHLLNFVQKNNPNVIGLSEKLFKPVQRDLSAARKFWEAYLSRKKVVKCIYSDAEIRDIFSIDHFIPWSYVAHDQLWNLIPTPKQINSSKSNNLPSIELYLNKFTTLQYDAFKTLSTSNLYLKETTLEDYLLFFNTELATLQEMPPKLFKDKLASHIKPMVEIATHLGFSSNWIWKPTESTY